MRNKRKQDSKQFQIDAVKLVAEPGHKVSEAARNVGIHQGIRRRWKKQLTAEGRPAFPGNEKMSPEKEELIRLHQENKPPKMKTEILNKAAAFLAKESMSDTTSPGRIRRLMSEPSGVMLWG